MRILTQTLAAILILTSVGFASEESKTRVEGRGVEARQDILKKSFESAQRAYLSQLSLRQSGKINSKPLALSRTQAFEVKASSWYDLALQWVQKNFRSLVRGTKKLSASLFSDKGVAPEIYGIYSEQITNGPNPVFYIGIDEFEGDVDHFVWDFGDGTGFIMPYEDFHENYYGLNHVFPSVGDYLVKVRAYNSEGDYTEAEYDVAVRNNQLPFSRVTVHPTSTANTVDIVIHTTDPDGPEANYAVRYGDGERYYGLDTKLTYTYPSAGSYELRVGTVDSLDAATYARTWIHVGIAPPASGSNPVVAANISPAFPVAPSEVRFDASHSFDLEGPISSYEWNFGDFGSFDNTSTAPISTHTYKSPGTYFGYLKVKDLAGNEKTQYFTVYVEAATPLTPQVLAVPTGVEREFMFDGNYYALSSAVSPEMVVWNFGDGSPQHFGPYPIHAYSSDGTYTVTLKIYDLKGNYREAQTNVVVSTSVSSPNAFFTASNTVNDTNTQVTFSTMNPTSVDPDTTAVWDFGDGTRISDLHQNVLNVSHTYTQKGIYVVTLATTNVQGISNRVQNSIVVRDTNSVQAVSAISPRIGQAPLAVRLDASGSTSQVGSVADYIWNVYSPTGTTQYRKSVATHSFEQGGGYRDIHLLVRDDQGNESIEFDRVLVWDPQSIPSGNQPPQAQMTISMPNGADPASFYFDGYSSFDPDSDEIVQYEWVLDGTTVISKGPSAGAWIAEEGEHKITLRVWDVWGNLGEVTKHFERASHTDITFDFIFGPLTPVVGETVHFIAENVVIPGRTIQEKIWDFGDGDRNCCVDTVTHVYHESGSYTVKLILKDNEGNLYEKTKNVVIYDPSAPTVVVTARDDENIRWEQSGTTLVLDQQPSKVNFDLNKSVSQGTLVDAQWNFGDGNTGYGTNPAWTYNKPGIYNVQVTATDKNGSVGTGSIQVEITNMDCPEADGHNGCLVVGTDNSRILPLSATSWTLSHDQGSFDFVAAPVEPDWVQVVRQDLLTDDDPFDPNGRTTDLGDVATVNGGIISIDRALFQAKNLNLTKSYKMMVSSKLTDGVDETFYYAESMDIFFGIGTANITANEEGVRFLIKGSRTGYQKYVELGTSTSISIGDLPVDFYSVIAEKGERSHTYDLNITSATAVGLSIDLSVLNLQRMEGEWQKEIKGRRAPDLKALQSYQNQRTMASSKQIEDYNSRLGIKNSEMPAWAYDSCGNAPPYPIAAPLRYPPQGKAFTNYFSSSSPNAASEYFKVTPDLGQKLKLSCRLGAGHTGYSHLYWKYILGRHRCWDGQGELPPIDPYWDIATTRASATHKPYEVLYDIKDGVTGEVVSKKIRFSPNEQMAEWGLTLRNITSKIGIPGTGVYDWGYRKNWEIEIPEKFQRPEARFFLNSFHNTATPEGSYWVDCDLERSTDMELPSILSVEPDRRASFDVKTAGPSYEPKANGERLIRHKFLPMSYDDETESPVNQGFPNIFKAKLKVTVHKGMTDVNQITNFGVDITYGTQTTSYSKPVEGWYTTANSSIAEGYVTIDVVDYQSAFTYDPGIDKVRLKISLPLIEGIGPEYIFDLMPLINVRALPPASQPCSWGFYSNRISAYAAPQMINQLNLYRLDKGFDFLCNDFSLPWGGLFKMFPAQGGPWKHDSHQDGRHADVRFANTSLVAANHYDLNEGANRLTDLYTYLRFASESHFIATSAEPLYASKRSSILFYCSLYPDRLPCTQWTQEGDITKLFVLQLCQWRQSATESIAGCPDLSPDNYLQAIARFSEWTKLNISRNGAMSSDFVYYISSGQDKPLNGFGLGGLVLSREWQFGALREKKWPDGSEIYEVYNGVILNQEVQGDVSGVKPTHSNRHYNHTHYKLR